MNRRTNSIIYFLLGLYTCMISWFYYHSIFWLIINYIFWPLSLIYFLLTGKLADNMWSIIPGKYF